MTVTVVLLYKQTVVLPADMARLKKGILTIIVSLHPGAVVHTKLYAPPAVNPKIEVLLCVGSVMTVGAGLVGSEVQVPVPYAAMMAESFLQRF